VLRSADDPAAVFEDDRAPDADRPAVLVEHQLSTVEDHAVRRISQSVVLLDDDPPAADRDVSGKVAVLEDEHARAQLGQTGRTREPVDERAGLVVEKVLRLHVGRARDEDFALPGERQLRAQHPRGHAQVIEFDAPEADRDIDVDPGGEVRRPPRHEVRGPAVGREIRIARPVASRAPASRDWTEPRAADLRRSEGREG
jgi:hypothetical protein